MANKMILIAIAAGLWANVLVSFTQPARADAESFLQAIQHDIHSIYSGNC